MAEEIREKVEALNAALGEMPYKLGVVSPREIKLLDKNARYMDERMFRSLVDNVKRDGGLSSIPLCYRREDGTLLVLSGNHRVQAAQHAELESILVLIIDKPLTREEQVAIQLSHNAIEGKDDQVILKELWSEIEDIELKLYTGLDEEFIRELEKVEFLSLAEARVDFKQIMLAFLPEDVEQLNAALGEMDMIFAGDENYVLSRKHFEEVFSALADVKDKYAIVNNPTAMMKLVALARERLSHECACQNSCQHAES